MEIPFYLQVDFSWWIDILADNNQSNKIRSGRLVREIFSNVSLNGWGAACGELRTRMVVEVGPSTSYKALWNLRQPLTASDVSQLIFAITTSYYASTTQDTGLYQQI